jgi:altronate hydrolase/galactarate dehydratase
MNPSSDASAPILRLHPSDNVVIALADLAEGLEIASEGVQTRQRIPRGHKIATKVIAPGESVRRYGQIIGQATARIEPGEHVHSHNLGMGEHDRDYRFATDLRPLPPVERKRQFMGYHRADGRVGTRNYLGVLTSVNCSATVARLIAEEAEKSDWFARLEHVDGIVPLVHGTGCGMAIEGEGYQTLFRTLAGHARHPNFAGILLVGLGCEVMQIPDLVGRARMQESDGFRYMTIQAAGGTRKTVERGVAILREMAEAAERARRAPAELSHLIVALQCGGSDSYSGITANPALGHASDLLVAHGGTTILAETPEIYGAEHLLTRRAVNEEVGRKLISLIEWWEDYTARNGGQMDNNPSPGNKRGGLTTILEKSLGAAAKGGTAPLAGVYRYAEPVDVQGFTFMDSPGYDPVSVTGQIASGANLVAFTTGRGSVSGFKPAPTIKLATNSEMYARMSEDMDVNCGDIIDEGVSVEEKGREIFELMIEVASGKRSKSEELGFGGAEFVPWQIGAVM